MIGNSQQCAPWAPWRLAMCAPTEEQIFAHVGAQGSQMAHTAHARALPCPPAARGHMHTDTHTRARACGKGKGGLEPAARLFLRV